MFKRVGLMDGRLGNKQWKMRRLTVKHMTLSKQIFIKVPRPQRDLRS